MGIKILGSNSSCRCNSCQNNYVGYSNTLDINPKPDNFQVLKVKQYTFAHVLEVKYPNCNNYEGIKILVRWGVFERPKELDPHFCEKTDKLVARFQPTSLGWDLACNVAGRLWEK